MFAASLIGGAERVCSIFFFCWVLIVLLLVTCGIDVTIIAAEFARDRSVHYG